MAETNWSEIHVIREELQEEEWAIKNVVKLLDEECTVPFIARYRKEMTNNMEVDKIRVVQNMLDELRGVRNKIANVMKALKKVNQLTAAVESSLKNSKCTEEIEHIYAPFKQGSKRSFAERARELGLESLAMKILNNDRNVNLQGALQTDKKGLSSLSEVETGLQHIIADVIAKDKDTMDKVRKSCETAYVLLTSTVKTTATKKTAAKKEEKKPSEKDDQKKRQFEQYHDFSMPVRNAKPHQVLAINRGESLKILTVKIVIPAPVKIQFESFCERKWIKPSCEAYTRKLIRDSMEDAYNRLIQPLMCRKIRSELTKTAEKASVDVFSANLNRLLLTPPIRGKVVLGIDPGFKHGCKLAVTSAYGEILETGVVYLHDYKTNVYHETQRLRNILMKHNCETIAIGNGTACRETETYISKQIKSGSFSPLNIMYCIVNEDGASIYSVSDEAQKEMPNLDPNDRGAVSIARRLQDPLAELVKIEPKHIGVGMYQHDISESQLKTALGGVVEECASFVGVDLNVCTESLLRRVSGLNSARAKKVVEWREANGLFINREQLRDVKGLGPKTFEQCAGFVKILPHFDQSSQYQSTDCKAEMTAGDTLEAKEEEEELTATGRKRKAKTTKTAKTSKKMKIHHVPNPLDRTVIHPESYEVATRFIKRLGGSIEEIGQQSLIKKVIGFCKENDMGKAAASFDVGLPTLKLITDALKQPLGYDIREEFQKPLFKQGVTSMASLKSGSILTGRVLNVTHFGAFVDIGVEKNGLIHVSKMNPRRMGGKRSVELGDKVEVKVLSIEEARGRISLELLTLM